MDSGFNPAILYPRSALVKIQTESEGFRKPFFMGGSQVPINLGLTQNQFSGSGFIPSSNTRTYIPKPIKYNRK
jgi:hypothetical protein